MLVDGIADWTKAVVATLVLFVPFGCVVDDRLFIVVAFVIVVLLEEIVTGVEETPVFDFVIN
jgi:hypothetical protein